MGRVGENKSDCHFIGQLKFRNKEPDAFIAGVGTGGTIMGVGKFLKEKNQDIKIYPLEPSNSPTLSTGWKVGKHRLQGISDEFIPSIVDLDKLDEVIAVDDGDAIIMAQMLASQLGIAVGISSGASLAAVAKKVKELPAGSRILTFSYDHGERYLSVDDLF